MNSYSKKLLKTFTLLGLSILFFGGKIVFAQGLESHVHGNAELNVVLVGRQLQLEFISPVMNLVGFERAPSSAKETALLENTSKNLQTSEWLIGDAFGYCQVSTMAFETPDYAEAHAHNEEGHNEHEAIGESHGNFRVQYLFECPATPTKEFRITAFTHFTGIEDITVQWITEAQQGLAVLTPNNSTLILE